MSADHVARNRAAWDELSDKYQAEHGPQLAASGGDAWGVWQVPESELRALGEVEGKDVLEFGCGAAQWAIALARRGARVTGLDLSPKQLEHARRAVDEAGVSVELVEGSAEDVPLPDESFDLVFCDHGAMNFTDPYRSVPEAARLLRTGGWFVFSHVTPLLELCWDPQTDKISERLVVDYFGLHVIDDGETTGFNLPYGEWVRLFRANGLTIEDLIEIQPAPDAETTYRDYAGKEWSRRWPGEEIWRLRKG